MFKFEHKRQLNIKKKCKNVEQNKSYCICEYTLNIYEIKKIANIRITFDQVLVK